MDDIIALYTLESIQQKNILKRLQEKDESLKTIGNGMCLSLALCWIAYVFENKDKGKPAFAKTTKDILKAIVINDITLMKVAHMQINYINGKYNSWIPSWSNAGYAAVQFEKMLNDMCSTKFVTEVVLPESTGLMDYQKKYKKISFDKVQGAVLLIKYVEGRIFKGHAVGLIKGTYKKVSGYFVYDPNWGLFFVERPDIYINTFILNEYYDKKDKDSELAFIIIGITTKDEST